MSNLLTVTGRAGRTTSCPARTRAYDLCPPTLIALTALGTWEISPVRSATAETTASTLRAPTSLVVVISPSASSVIVDWPSRMVAVYVLPEPTRKVRSLVARLMPRTRTPVAIGSRVPAWPTLRVPHSRRQRATTSWLVQPAGLSTMRSPSGVVIVYGAILGGVELLVRVCITGIGGTSGGRRHLRVALLGRQKQILHVGRTLRKGVRDELQGWRQPDADDFAHCRAELALARLESHLSLSAFVLATEHGVEDRRILQIAGHPHVGDRDEAQSLVLDPVLQRLGDEHLDAVRNLLRARRISHGPTFLAMTGGGTGTMDDPQSPS